MDKSLLDSRRGLATDPHAENNEHTEPPASEIEQAAETEQEFRELIPAAPQPRLRMKFDPPVDYDGQTYSEIICDFEKLIGADFMRCEREFRALYKPIKGEIPFAEMNPLYHSILIAKASDLPLGLIRKLPGRYYTPLRTEALKICGSSPDEEKA